MTSSVYTPLHGSSDIRLLHLQPGKGQDPLIGELEICSLDNFTRPWTALSYTWGSVDWRGHIKCNGIQVSLRGNLHSALSGIRRPDKSILLWADALCINQDDCEEKEIQLGLMGRIYSTAFLVVADIGDAGQDYNDIVAILNALIKLTEDKNYLKRIESDDFVQYGLPSITHPKWQKFYKFLARPWFRRIWIQQEYTLASQVNMMYGTDQIAGNTIPEAIHRSMQRGLLDSILDGSDNRAERKAANESCLAMSAMLTTRREIQLEQNKGLFHYLRHLSAFCEATDNRDRVYALLGLASDSPQLSIHISYSDSVATVYRRTAKALIEQGEGFNVLYEAGCYEHLEDLPSWAPNWSGVRCGESLGLCETDQWADSSKGMYRASGSTPLTLVFGAEPLKPRARGMHVCSITALTEPYVDDTPCSLELRKYRLCSFQVTCNNLIVRHKDQLRYDTAESLLEASWRIFLNDTVRDNSRKLKRPAPSHLKEGFVAFSAYCGSVDSMGRPKERLSDQAAAFMTLCEPRWKGKRMCIMSDGNIALVPWRAREGDKIYVLLGASVPFVIRGSANSRDIIVGDCYIHGQMDGEALLMARPDGEIPIQDMLLD